MTRIAWTLLLAHTAAVPAAALAQTPATGPAPPAQLAGVPVALLFDNGSGQVLFERAPDRRFVPASMAKVMTAFVAFQLMDAGKLHPERRFTVAPDRAARWSGRGTTMYLKANEKVRAADLLHGIATASANDASVVLAEGYAGSVTGWTALMNREARWLGMSGSHFNTPSGWPDGGATFVTARDLVTLGSALIERHPEPYRRYFGQKRFVWNGSTLESRDPTVDVVAGADGIKTGYTSEAGYNFLGSAERDGRRLIMVVAGAKTDAQRAAASRSLLEWGFSAWTSRTLFPQGATIGKARVQGGSARNVDLVAPRAVSFVSFDPRDRLTARVVYQGPLVAPLAEGARVASLEITASSGLSAQVPLVAATSVEQAGPLDRLVNGLMSLFP